MELEKFITATLTEIQKGVQGAIDATMDTKGVINPHFDADDSLGSHLVQQVQFDIAVTVSSESELSGSGGIKVVGIEFGAKGKDSAENTSVSRVQFTIPVIPPVQVVDADSGESTH